MNNSLLKYNFPGAADLQKKVEQSQYVIGLDLHKKTTAMTIFDQQGDKQKPVFQRKRLHLQ